MGRTAKKAKKENSFLNLFSNIIPTDCCFSGKKSGGWNGEKGTKANFRFCHLKHKTISIFIPQLLQQNMYNLYTLIPLYQWLNPREWQSQYLNNKLTITNTLTGEEFTSEKIPVYSQHVQQIYKTRAAHPLPHTPKIILAEQQNQEGFLSMLVERGALTFDKYVEECCNDVLMLGVFRDLLGLVMVLCRRYGLFRVQKKNIKMTRLGFFQIWIHSEEEQCHREFPLNSGDILLDTKTMIVDLINIFVKSKNHFLFSFLLQKMHQEKVFTFETAKYYVEETIQKAKEKSPPKKTLLQSKLPEFLRKKSTAFKKPKKNEHSPLYQTAKEIKNHETEKKQQKKPQSRTLFFLNQSASCKQLKQPLFTHNREATQKIRTLFDRREVKSNEKKKDKWNNVFKDEDKKQKTYLTTPHSPNVETPTQLGAKADNFLYIKQGKESDDSVETTKFINQNNSLKMEELSDRRITTIGRKPGDEEKSIFKMKNLKIIEENGEEQQKHESINEGDVEKELQTLLSEKKRPKDKKLVTFENQMNSILFG